MICRCSGPPLISKFLQFFTCTSNLESLTWLYSIVLCTNITASVWQKKLSMKLTRRCRLRCGMQVGIQSILAAININPVLKDALIKMQCVLDRPSGTVDVDVDWAETFSEITSLRFLTLDTFLILWKANLLTASYLRTSWYLLVGEYQKNSYAPVELCVLQLQLLRA